MKKSFLMILTLLSIKIAAQQCWQSVVAGYDHSVGIGQNGTLWTWGRNDEYQLGSNTDVSFSLLPIQIGTATNWQSAAAGSRFTVAKKADGTLWAWGYNDKGQLGTGNLVNRNAPVQIGTATNWFKVYASNGSSFAIKNDGSLWAWGDNQYGRASPPAGKPIRRTGRPGSSGCARG